jgi:molecular chaperone DnaJ
VNIEECHRILRVKENAGLDDVKRAFRAMAFKLHPDLNPDDPHAARHFQRVNEAYVLLKQHLEAKLHQHDPGEPRAASRAGKGQQARSQAGGESRTATSSGGARSRAGRTSQERKQTTGAAGGPAGPPPGKEDVLHEILKDPFARQVFEDIYSQIRRSGGKGLVTTRQSPEKKKLHFQWGANKFELDLSEGVWNGTKAFMRSWLDERQTVYLPPVQLRPGTRVRLQVRQGWSGKKVSVEVTLPRDYVTGRAVRLKGLGRKIGPLVGDLYVYLMAR